LVLNEKINLDNDAIDLSEDYFRRKYQNIYDEDESYFPDEASKPPHY
tara:strand:- start:108 stop:248 length:141 start_codon:yes stop_codon:yes gene_type:complete